MDWSIYWFMFPVAVAVAATATLSGIGGAALFTPIFLIIFPLLGSEYPLATPVAAIGSALFTQLFGFLSGFVGYFRRRLIDFRSAIPFILIAAPIAVLGALFAHEANQSWLKTVYAALMVVLSIDQLQRRASDNGATPVDAEAEPQRIVRTIVSREGVSYSYYAPRQGAAIAGTSIGAFLTGMLSVGIGEVLMPQLLRSRVPVAVAAATSVFIVIVVVMSASFTHISALIAGGGLSAVPWNLVCWTIPGVIIGGQIGPRLQGRISQSAMHYGIAVLFGVIGLSVGYTAVVELATD